MTRELETTDPTQGSSRPMLRLARVLGKHKEALGSYVALANAITERFTGVASSEDTKAVIDRRKLRRLVANDTDELVLSFTELRALDAYLEPFGEGLAHRPLFEKPNLLQHLAESGRVTFLLGSKPTVEGGSFPHWDVLAMAELQRRLTAYEVSVQLDIQDVAMHPDFDPDKFSASSSWAKAFAGRGSLVCFGSTRLMPAAEYMLCEMFGGKPFAVASLVKQRELPFRFVWNPTLEALPSRFRLELPEIADLDPQAHQRIEAGEASGLVLGNEVFVDPVTASGWGDAYGLCVAQRRAHGQIWLLLAGVSGPATLATANVASRMTMELLGENGDAESPPIVSVVSGKIGEADKEMNKSLREFGEEIRVPPTAWGSDR